MKSIGSPLVDAHGHELSLSPAADAFARKLRARYPGVVFLSGRRDLESQACAMAGHCAIRRDWVLHTYVASPIRDALCAWLAANPLATGAYAISRGFISVLRGFSEVELLLRFRHISGDAFDLDRNNLAMRDWLRAQAAAEEIQFLEWEGGLAIWHVAIRAQHETHLPQSGGGNQEVQ